MAKTFKQIQKMDVICTKTNLDSYKNRPKEEFDIYKEYLEKEARIFNIEHNKEVIEAALKNGTNPSNINKLNIFEIDKEFKKDSFDACISRCVLEHFSKDQIRDIIDKLLFLAPIVMASFPVRTKSTLKYYGVKEANGKEVCNDKIHRNLWTEYFWKENILEFYNIQESYIKKCSPLRGNFDEMHVVIERECPGEEFGGIVDEPDRENRMAELFTGSYGWSEELSAFELYLMDCFDFPFKASFRSNEYGDKKTIFTVIHITCCRDKGGVFCEIRLGNGKRKEVPVYSINPIDKKHKRNIALNDYLTFP